MANIDVENINAAIAACHEVHDMIVAGKIPISRADDINTLLGATIVWKVGATLGLLHGGESARLAREIIAATIRIKLGWVISH